MEKVTPKLRFPEFKKNWENKSFNSLYTFKSTNSFSRENLNYENGEIKNIHYGDIHTKFNTLFDITKEKVPFINPTIDISKIKEDSYVEKGDLIIADASENYDDIGKMIEVVNVNDEKLVAGLHTFLAKRKNSNNAIGFTANLVKTWNVRQQILKIAQGTKVLSLSTGRLGEVTLTIPQPEEQQKIASFLTSVDERLTLLAQQKEKLELYKKGVMQQIFSQKLRFKDENENEYPDWEEKKLGDICKLQGGFAFKSNEFKETGIPVIRISNISNHTNHIDLNSIVFYNKIEKDENFTIKKGDLIIAMSGATTGKSSIYNLEYYAYLNQRVGLFKSLTNKLEYNFLIQFVFSDLFKKQLDSLLVAGAQPNISSKDIESLSIPFPVTEEQQKIASFLSAIDAQIEGVSKKIEQTKLFKKGLLQQMFV